MKERGRATTSRTAARSVPLGSLAHHRSPSPPVREVALPYGAGTRLVEIPDDATVLRPRSLPGLEDPDGAVRAALARPRGARASTSFSSPGPRWW